MSDKMSSFATNIMQMKYSHTKADDTKETWEDIARRVTKNVMAEVPIDRKLKKRIEQAICDRKFIPAGRYLYACGRQYHQVQNCLLLRAEDSREGWAELLHKAAMALMTGAGIGIDYSGIRAEGKKVRKTGGFATGPLALMQMMNECGRGIMQGGSRRSAIWAGLSWQHPDIHKFIDAKNWPSEIRELKSKNFNFPATLDGTNISVILDDEFFKAYNNDRHSKHAHAHSVYWATIKRMLKTGEPGFSVNLGQNSKETLRNAPIHSNTHVLTKNGYKQVIDIVNKPITIWTGKQWARDVVFHKTIENAELIKVKFSNNREIVCEPNHEFLVEKYIGKGKKYRKLESIDRVRAIDLQAQDILHVSMPTYYESSFDENGYTFGYIYGDGCFHKILPRAEITFCTTESQKCSKYINTKWLTKSDVYMENRGYLQANTKNLDILKNRCKSMFPIDIYAKDINFICSFIAGLFDADGNYVQKRQLLRLGSIHFNFLKGTQRLLDQIGISSSIIKGSTGNFKNSSSKSWFLIIHSNSIKHFQQLIPTKRINVCADNYNPYRQTLIKVKSIGLLDEHSDVYCCDTKVPEHSFMAEGIIISNCTEVCSEDDSDICNLGSINMAAIDTIEEFKKVVELATAFLLAGTLYSDVPYPKVDQIRSKNRRLGLGVMGVHEWLLKRDKPYAPDEELGKWLEIYATSTEIAARYAEQWDISKPVKTRAIAPTGTIGILAETTTGIEPIFAVAYKRRYLKHHTWHYEYVVDPCAARLIESGIPEYKIEDAFKLSEDIEKRVQFQAWVQQYVDHGISSTINLPAWKSQHNNDYKILPFGEMLLKYLPKLRGITVFPDGSRSGQPLTPVKYSTAVKYTGEVVQEQADICLITKGGSCGE